MMADLRSVETKRRKPLKADYGDATPEQAAEAVLRYRPGKPPRKIRKAKEDLALEADVQKR